jgi:hypothetical protein
MERLELSQHKLLGPKSSASTNSATSVICQLFSSLSLILISIKRILKPWDRSTIIQKQNLPVGITLELFL